MEASPDEQQPDPILTLNDHHEPRSAEDEPQLTEIEQQLTAELQAQPTGPNPPKKTGNKYDLATRAQIVILRAYTTLQIRDITASTGATPRQIQRFVATAKERGWSEGHPIKAFHLKDKEDKPKGRPRKRDEDLKHARRVPATKSATPLKKKEERKKPGPKPKSGMAGAGVMEVPQQERMVEMALDPRITGGMGGEYVPAWTD